MHVIYKFHSCHSYKPLPEQTEEENGPPRPGE